MRRSRKSRPVSEPGSTTDKAGRYSAIQYHSTSMHENTDAHPPAAARRPIAKAFCLLATVFLIGWLAVFIAGGHHHASGSHGDEHASQAEGAHGEEHVDSEDLVETIVDESGHPVAPPLWGIGILPFLIILGCIAILPLLSSTQHWWESNLSRYMVALLVSLGTMAYFWVTEGAAAIGSTLDHAILIEYIPFIVLLFCLYVISGGIQLTGDVPAHPMTNVIYLAVGALIASFIGTTGSKHAPDPADSQDEPRTTLQGPYHRHVHLPGEQHRRLAAAHRRSAALSSATSPGFHLNGPSGSGRSGWQPACCSWLSTGSGTAFSIGRSRRLRSPSTRPTSNRFVSRDPSTFSGSSASSSASRSSTRRTSCQAPGWYPFEFFREFIMLLLVAVSLLLTPRTVREGNQFNYHAIIEVAALFIGIFIAMQVPIAVLKAHGAEITSQFNEPWMYFWMTGILSSVLDNAPTYLVFFNLAQTGTPPEGAELVALGGGGAIPVDLLAAISLGAVFMGSMTYIGNGPNFMVKAIAEHSGVRMPSFIGFMFKYSIPVLVPVFILVVLFSFVF